jgi:sterol desaturase/sphingolipid hydroxylase (fatty acid hydroxylase superfamily)
MHSSSSGPISSAQTSSLGRLCRHTVSYGFFPLALGCTLVFIYLEVQGFFGPLGKAYPIYLGLMIGIMLVLEWLVPLRREWSMTWVRLLSRDVPLLLLNAVTIAVTSYVVTAMARGWGGGSGALAHVLPWWAQAITAILICDFIWYWVHRYSHEGKGRLGQWLWKVHALHHMPEQVYVFMHAVGHPLNSAYVRVILMLPPIILGMSPEAVFAASVLTGFQGLVSHFNVDIRAAWLNRVLMGTQLHRYHHSADPVEGKNYAAVITLWDQLFGTYDEHLGQQPLALGLQNRATYPGEDQWAAWLALPFKLRHLRGDRP